MKIFITTSELDELILIMQVSSQEIQTAIDQSHDIEEIDAYRMHRRIVQEWLKRFEQLKSDKETQK